MDLQTFQTYQITALEQKFLRELSEKHHQGEKRVSIDEISCIKEVERNCVQEIRKRLDNYGFLNDAHEETGISELGLKYLYHLDNPPPKDYWADITVWFKSKRWSIPVFLLIVVIPLLTSWLQIIQWIIKLTFGSNSE